MRYDRALGPLAAVVLMLNQGAMALGHCSAIVPVEDHRGHEGMGHRDTPEEAPTEDGNKGCHACLRKRVLPIKG